MGKEKKEELIKQFYELFSKRAQEGQVMVEERTVINKIIGNFP